MSQSQNPELEKALAALRLLRETCSAAIDALRQPLSPMQTALLSERPSCSVLQKDYQSLLTLVYTSTTKLTLVLRPSAPSYTAALAPISDLGTSITSLATCATLHDIHGITLSSYARQATRDICATVSSLADTFIENAGEEYLVRTGTVHDLVEKARREIPADNLAAVKGRWMADRGMLEDSLEEISSMLEGGGGDDIYMEDFDDEWDELGFGSSTKMSGVELERTRKVQPLVRFAILLHKRVIPDVLAGLSGPRPDSEALTTALDALPARSHAVVLALEEVVAALYAPQQPAALSSAVAAFSDAVRLLHTSVVTDVLLPPETGLVNAMVGLNVIETKSGGAKAMKDPRKWFDACLVQIDKSAKAVDDMLLPVPHNAT